MGLSGVECPLPEVAEALTPYIHTREETANVRHAVNSVFQLEDAPINNLNLLSSTITVSDKKLVHCTGVRKAYADALDAHKAAQARLESLRRDIHALHDNPGSKTLEDRNRDLESLAITESIEGIRRNQRRQKLQIIERAFDDIEEQARNRGSLDERLGGIQCSPQQPHLVQPHQSNSVGKVEAQILELKKAVIKAQRDANVSKTKLSSKSAFYDGTSRTDDSVRTTALRTARDELIRLIEAELAKLPEPDSESVEADVTAPEMRTNGGSDLEADKDGIQRVYEEYINARKELTATMNARKAEPSSELDHGLAPRDDLSNISRHQTQTTPLLAARILPFTSELRTLSEAEQAVMEQSSYLRRQMAFASNKIRRSTLRLADESLLVAPGAATASAWVEAAGEARSNDREMSEARLESGEEALRNARATMRRMHAIAHGES